MIWGIFWQLSDKSSKFWCKFDIIRCIFDGHWNTIKNASKFFMRIRYNSIGIRFLSIQFDGNSIPNLMGIESEFDSYRYNSMGIQFAIRWELNTHRIVLNSHRKFRYFSDSISMTIKNASNCIEFASKFDNLTDNCHKIS